MSRGQGYDRDRDGPSRGEKYAGLTNVCFVGNLPYNCTEEQLVETFSQVGHVLNARLVFDHATGRMKGFGFVEFYDNETASSAVRNLSGLDMDGRILRVDHAEPEKTGPTAGRVSTIPTSAALPTNLPTGVAVPPGMSATDSITQTLATMPPNQLLDIMSQMKSLVTTSPDQARALLNGQPQLTYALFQAMLMMKVVDPSVLQRMLAPAPAAPIVAAAPFAQPVYAPPVAQAQLTYATAVPQTYSNPNLYGMTIPAATPVQSTAPSAQPASSQLLEQQQALIKAAMAATPESLAALPPEHRNAIMAIRRNLATAGVIPQA